MIEIKFRFYPEIQDGRPVLRGCIACLAAGYMSVYRRIADPERAYLPLLRVHGHAAQKPAGLRVQDHELLALLSSREAQEDAVALELGALDVGARRAPGSKPWRDISMSSTWGSISAIRILNALTGLSPS